MKIAHEQTTIHQDARTDLLNSYGKYMNKQMYAELWNYTLECEKVSKLLELYQTFHKQLSLHSKVESYDDSWGMPADCEVLWSNNSLTEISIVDEELIDLFNQIKVLEEELNEHLR